MKKTTLLGLVFALAVLGYLVSTSFRKQAYKCKVCITFQGRNDCRTGTGDTQESALRTAVTTTCAQLSSGVIMSNQCENTQPDSVDWIR